MSGAYVEIHYSPKMGQWYALNGNETFFDDQDYMLFWDSPEDVREWLKENRPGLIIKPLEETKTVKPLQSSQVCDNMEANGNGAGKAPEV